ncbi:hypothetical protein ACOTEN_15215, partial [Achromobacter xylosoxidans]
NTRRTRGVDSVIIVALGCALAFQQPLSFRVPTCLPFVNSPNADDYLPVIAVSLPILAARPFRS